MSGFSLRYYQPLAPLREWVTVYYLFKSDLPVMEDNLRAELPQVRFAWRGDTTISLAGLQDIEVPRASLTGPSYTAIRFQARGPYRMFGAGLRPAGWAALIGAGASELANLPMDLEQIVGATARRTLHQMAEAQNDAGRIAAIEGFFLSLAMHARQQPLWFTRVVDCWLSGSHNPEVGTLERSLGLSSRQIERLALRIYGAAPKLLARKARAVQSAIRLGCNPEGGWEEAAAEAYYDQSHFIRDFKTFIGMTPGDYASRATSSLIRRTIDEP